MHSDKLTILLDKLTCLKPLGLVIWFGFLRIGSKIQIESTFSDFQTFLKRDPIEDLVWRKNLWIRQQWLWLKHLMPNLCHCMCGKVIVLLSTYTVEVFELQSYLLLKFAKKNQSWLLTNSSDFLQLRIYEFYSKLSLFIYSYVLVNTNIYFHVKTS